MSIPSFPEPTNELIKLRNSLTTIKNLCVFFVANIFKVRIELHR